MDPNSQNPQGDSEAVKKLENDLNTLTEETKSVESQPAVSTTIPEEQPPVASPTVEAPPVVPPTPTTDQVEPKKKGSPLMVVAIVLVVLAVLAVVIYMFESKFLTLKPLSTPTPIAVVTPIPDPTANWKTYTDTTNAYSFRYPENWILSEDCNNQLPIMSCVWSANFDPSSLQSSTKGTTAGAYMGLSFDHPQQAGEILSLGDYSKLCQGGDTSFTGTCSNSNVAGKSALAMAGSSNEIVHIILSDILGVTIQFGYNAASSSSDLSTFNQILSTFKFVSATPSASPTSSPSATLIP